MPVASDSAVYCGFSIPKYSQIANVIASGEFRKSGEDVFRGVSHYANMVETEDKNGGPNHLADWMRFRGVKGVELAKELGIGPGMVSDLANSNRALSAKWLRRIAPVLDTTPGMLLDHNPYDLDNDIIDIWSRANQDARRKIVDMAKVVVRDERSGTTG